MGVYILRFARSARFAHRSARFAHRSARFAHRSARYAHCSARFARSHSAFLRNAIHSYTYTSADNEIFPLVGTLHVFQTVSVLQFIHSNLTGILSLGIDVNDLQKALASPIVILGLSAQTITAFATIGEKRITCKNSWIGLPGERFTTDVSSFSVSLFGAVRGLRKPLATYTCAVAHAAGYKVVAIPEPYNVHFSCTKTDIMGSKVLYVATTKSAFAPIALKMDAVDAIDMIEAVATAKAPAKDQYEHIFGCELKEPLFAVPPLFPVIPAVEKTVQPYVPSLIPEFLDDDERVISQMLEDMGLVISVEVDPELFEPALKRPRAFSLEECSSAKRMCMA